MSKTAQPIPTLFLALLVGDIVLAVIVGLLVMVSMGLTSGSGAGMGSGLLALAIVMGSFVAVTALAWWLWTRGHIKSALVVALIPFIVLLPIGPLIFGLGAF